MDSTDLALVKVLVPFRDMTEKQLEQAVTKAQVCLMPTGKMLFKRNDEDDCAYWLLSGSMDLLDEKFEAKRRTAGDEAAKHPIDNNTPHKLTAVTTEDSKILIVDRADIGLFNSSQSTSPDVKVEEDESVDWMSTLLSSPLFEFIPPANIQLLFSKFEETRYDAGDVVIKQGETGDYFYVIQTGKVKIERTVSNKTSLQAELKAGDNFGQDALVGDIPRNATITMLTKGTMMRLSAPDFESLLMKPVVEKVSLKETREMIAHGDPKTFILDVRNPKEVESGMIDGAVNVPVLLIRKNLKKLKQEAIYVTSCNTGKRAKLAAYILNEKGFTAYVLKTDQANTKEIT